MIGPKIPQREADIILFPPHPTSHPLVAATNVRTIRVTDRPPVRTVDAVIRSPRPKSPTRSTGERIVIGLKVLGALLATAATAAVVYLVYLAVMAVIGSSLARPRMPSVPNSDVVMAKLPRDCPLYTRRRRTAQPKRSGIVPGA